MTIYIGPEKSLGCRMKLVLLQVYDMGKFDNLQIYEMEALLHSVISRMDPIRYTTLLNKTRLPKKAFRCPTCQAHSCGDDLHTVSKYLSPCNSVGDRLKVCEQQFWDAASEDGLKKPELMKLVSSLIKEHIIEVDLAKK